MKGRSARVLRALRKKYNLGEFRKRSRRAKRSSRQPRVPKAKKHTIRLRTLDGDKSWPGGSRGNYEVPLVQKPGKMPTEYVGPETKG